MKITHKTINGQTEIIATYGNKINITILLYAGNTRHGFKHEGNCRIIDNEKSDFVASKICYLNRTWESYRYQSLIHKMMKACKKIDSKRIDNFMKKIDDYAKKNCSWGW